MRNRLTARRYSLLLQMIFKLVSWGEVRTPTSTKPPTVGLHFIQPNLRVVAIEDDAVLGGRVAFQEIKFHKDLNSYIFVETLILGL